MEKIMATVIHDRALAERLIAQRRAWGADHHDEVWEGVYMMSPLAGNEHQRIVGELTAILLEVVGRTGLATVLPGANVSDRVRGWEQNYRCPDVVVFFNDGKAVDHGTFWYGGPDFLAEVVSPDDQTYEKLPFYESIATREVLVIDRKPWALVLYQFANGKLIESGRATVQNGAMLASQVVGLSFRLFPGQPRPQIEVTHTGGQRWVI